MLTPISMLTTVYKGYQIHGTDDLDLEAKKYKIDSGDTRGFYKCLDIPSPPIHDQFVMGTCPVCQGTGDTGTITCPQCHGKGSITRINVGDQWKFESQDDIINQTVDSWNRYLESLKKPQGETFSREDVKRLMGIVHDSAQQEINRLTTDIQLLRDAGDKLSKKQAELVKILSDIHGMEAMNSFRFTKRMIARAIGKPDY